MSENNEKKDLNAVHERDLDNLLDKLGLKQDFYSGKIKCKFCKDTITKDNIYSMIAESGHTNFVCDKPGCISDFMLHLDEKNNIRK